MYNALPAVLLLIGLPHLGLKSNRPTSPADTLPPPWKSASRLALEDQFVLGRLQPLVLRGPSLRLSADPRTLHVQVNPTVGTVSMSPRLGEVPLGPGITRDFATYARQSSELSYQNQWRERSRQSLNVRAASTGPAAFQGLQFKLPSPLPKKVQSLLGPGGPALNVSGSENIRLSGQSDWTNLQVGPLGQKRSLFPTLNMQQDLDIRLEGQLSDRVRVNLLQNSANQIPLANRIAINYRGDEDDLVQALDMGNTSLTLPGTQYVSYSGKNEGLFGIKTAMRTGPLDLTVLATKQEGRSERASYAGASRSQKQTLNDFDYLKGQYYFLYDPNEPTLDVDDASVVVFRDNVDYTTNVNTVRGRALVDPRTLTPGASAYLDTVSVRGSFARLTAGADKDYEILRDVYGPYYKIIKLKRQMTGDQRLAVTFRARPAGSTGPYDIEVGRPVDQPITDDDGVPAVLMKLVRPPARLLLPDSVNTPDRQVFETDPNRAPFNITRELELKNFYQLPGQRIDPATMRIDIRQGNYDPPRYSEPAAPGIPYIELAGLDSWDETGGSPVQGAHDGKVDGTVVATGTRPFVDYENGILFFPDPRPFAPRLGAGGKFFDQAVSNLLFRRDSLTGEADPHSGSSTPAQNAANPAIYDNYNPRRELVSTYFIDVEFTAAQAAGEIVLGRGNILENSEVVSVNGQAWVRDRDYTIDYDLGRVVLKRQLGPGDNLNVDYSYAPLFQQAGRTLVGSAFRLEGRERSLGGAFIYESRGAQDLRPRIGEEPSRSVIGDLNTEFTLRPTWLTRLADRLPGVRTTAPSEMHALAEVGVSFPNPNTQNEVYIDDMEGVRDAVSLNLAQERWHWSSPPRLSTGPGASAPVTEPVIADTLHDAEVHWYSPPNYVKESDLKPNLTDAEGAQNSHQVLAISVPRRPRDAASDSTRLWVGVTYPLDQVGLDLARSQFIELWVDDFNDLHDPGDGMGRIRGRHVRLHVDLGAVNEDQMRSPDVDPNGALDSEDLPPRDNVLTVTDAQNEDTGVDGKLSRDEVVAEPGRDLTTADASDPEGDNFSPPDDAVLNDEKRSIDPALWRRVNGTEDNRRINPQPDTEDLNLNGNLDLDDDYIEYTIDLGDPESRYLVTDVQRDFGSGSSTPSARVRADNGWRRYRIPIDDSLAVRFGNPNLALTRHVRVWLQGIVETDPVGMEIGRPLVMLGGLDIVGSRWQQADFDSAALALPLTTMTLNSVNSVDNADIYVPPFDPGQTRTGSQELTRREQSISLEFTDLKPNSTLEGFRTFSLDEDYSRYSNMRFYATGYGVEDAAGTPYDAAVDTALFYFVRFASDELSRNYYEYRARLPRSPGPRQIDWATVQLPLTALSNLKLDPRFPTAEPIRFAVPYQAPGESLIVNGRPSFTRVRRISFGILNATGKTFSTGQLWFDELRSTDIYKNVDHAQRVAVNGRVANLMSYNLAWNGRGADFLSVGETRGSGNATDQLAFGGNFDLHRFFESTGIILPLNFNYSRNLSRPRYTAGDDVLRTGVYEKTSETRTEARSFSTSYSRAWGDRSNPLLRYTVGGITANFARGQNRGTNPYSVDSTVTTAAAVNYGIAPRRLLVIPMPGVKQRFYPLPERFYWNYSVGTIRSQSFDRIGPQRDSLRKRTDLQSRAAFIDFGADTRPFDFFHHHFEARRNLSLPDTIAKTERLGFINLGRVVNWRQNMDARFSLSHNWARPTFSWNSMYAQNNGPELSRDLSVRSVSNGQTVSLSVELPFDRLDDVTGAPRRTQDRRSSPPPGPGGGGMPPGGGPPPGGGMPPGSPGEMPGGAMAPPGQDPRATGGESGGMPPRPAGGDSLRGPSGLPSGLPSGPSPGVPMKPSGPPLWRSALAHLGAVSAEWGFNKSSAWTRIVGTPSPMYMLGLTSDPDSSRVDTRFGNDASEAMDWHAGARTRITLARQSAVNVRFDYLERRNTANTIRNRSSNMRFPELDVDYGRMSSVLMLDKVFTNPQLRTSYSRVTGTEYSNNSDTPTGRTAGSEWRPLFGLTGSLRNGTRTEFKIEKRSTERENMLIGHSITSDRLTTTYFSVSRSYSQGQKVGLFGKKSTVSSSVTVGLTGQYETHSGETIQYADAGRSQPLGAQFPVSESRLSVNGNGSYAFSSNLTGNLSLGYGQNSDKQRSIVRRNIRVELRAQFTF